MRLRITRQPSGSIDGIQLRDFVVGSIYEVGTTLGCFLLAEGLAEPATEASDPTTVRGIRTGAQDRLPGRPKPRPEHG